MSQLAYKFLAHGARGPISGFDWSIPRLGGAGDWSPVGLVELCRSGVHACRLPDLAYWLHEELWRVELDGDWIEGYDCLVAPRGRLLERVDDWSEHGGARDFARAVRDHAIETLAAHPEHPDLVRLQGYVDDATWHVKNGLLESPALAGLCASMAVAQAALEETLEEAYRRERAWQSAWIVTHMKLT